MKYYAGRRKRKSPRNKSTESAESADSDKQEKVGENTQASNNVEKRNLRQRGRKRRSSTTYPDEKSKSKRSKSGDSKHISASEENSGSNDKTANNEKPVTRTTRQTRSASKKEATHFSKETVVLNQKCINSSSPVNPEKLKTPGKRKCRSSSRQRKKSEDFCDAFVEAKKVEETCVSRVNKSTRRSRKTSKEVDESYHPWKEPKLTKVAKQTSKRQTASKTLPSEVSFQDEVVLHEKVITISRNKKGRKQATRKTKQPENDILDDKSNASEERKKTSSSNKLGHRKPKEPKNDISEDEAKKVDKNGSTSMPSASPIKKRSSRRVTKPDCVQILEPSEEENKPRSKKNTQKSAPKRGKRNKSATELPANVESESEGRLSIGNTKQSKAKAEQDGNKKHSEDLSGFAVEGHQPSMDSARNNIEVEGFPADKKPNKDHVMDIDELAATKRKHTFGDVLLKALDKKEQRKMVKQLKKIQNIRPTSTHVSQNDCGSMENLPEMVKKSEQEQKGLKVLKDKASTLETLLKGFDPEIILKEIQKANVLMERIHNRIKEKGLSTKCLDPVLP